MVKYLYNLLNTYTEVDRIELVSADEILEGLEHMGMQPPGYMKPIPFEDDGKQYPLVPGDFKNNNGIWCTPGVQEWEDEDEAQ